MAVQFASHVPKMARTTASIDTSRKAALGDALLDVNEHVGEITLTVSAKASSRCAARCATRPASNISS